MSKIMECFCDKLNTLGSYVETYRMTVMFMDEEYPPRLVFKQESEPMFQEEENARAVATVEVIGLPETQVKVDGKILMRKKDLNALTRRATELLNLWTHAFAEKRWRFERRGGDKKLRALSPGVRSIPFLLSKLRDDLERKNSRVERMSF